MCGYYLCFLHLHIYTSLSYISTTSYTYFAAQTSQDAQLGESISEFLSFCDIVLKLASDNAALINQLVTKFSTKPSHIIDEGADADASAQGLNCVTFDIKTTVDLHVQLLHTAWHLATFKAALASFPTLLRSLSLRVKPSAGATQTSSPNSKKY